ncbi:MAG TPA: nuclear transport factor 2 family protein [Myxococcota bacterium]|nr:nuclear transport factor 2 family protein [Myxococcota bacterium]
MADAARAGAHPIAELLRRYAACISAGDKAGIVALYAEDATAEIPVGGPVHRGIDAIRGFYYGNELAERVEITGAICIAGCEAAAPMRALVARADGLVEIDVIDVVEVDLATQRFKKLRAFFDLAGARRVSQ